MPFNIFLAISVLGITGHFFVAFYTEWNLGWIMPAWEGAMIISGSIGICLGVFVKALKNFI